MEKGVAGFNASSIAIDVCIEVEIVTVKDAAHLRKRITSTTSTLQN